MSSPGDFARLPMTEIPDADTLSSQRLAALSLALVKANVELIQQQHSRKQFFHSALGVYMWETVAATMTRAGLLA